MNEVRHVVWSDNSSLPLADPNTVGYYYKQSMARTSFTLVMLAVAGSMALLLGVAGIYGVISYSVTQRMREIGIRMALGAQRGQILGMFVRDGLLLTEHWGCVWAGGGVCRDATDAVAAVWSEPVRSADVCGD